LKKREKCELEKDKEIKGIMNMREIENGGKREKDRDGKRDKER